jgi:hypothetical protein
MRYLCFIPLLTLLISFGAFAKKNIISKTTPDGVVVLIDNNKVSASDNDLKVKHLTYDITLASFSDSVAFTATIVSKDAFKADSASIMNAKRSKVERIYIEPSGNKWKNRLRFYISYEEFEELKDANTPPMIVWYISDRKYSFVLSASNWEKQQATWQYASQIIENNK